MDPICLQVFAAGRQSRSVKGLRPSGQLHSLEHGRERGGGVTHLQIRYFAGLPKHSKRESFAVVLYTQKNFPEGAGKRLQFIFDDLRARISFFFVSTQSTLRALDEAWQVATICLSIVLETDKYFSAHRVRWRKLYDETAMMRFIKICNF